MKCSNTIMKKALQMQRGTFCHFILVIYLYHSMVSFIFSRNDLQVCSMMKYKANLLILSTTLCIYEKNSSLPSLFPCNVFGIIQLFKFVECSIYSNFNLKIAGKEFKLKLTQYILNGSITSQVANILQNYCNN